MKIDILTIFPEMFYSFIGTSIMKRGIEKNIIQMNIVDIRNFSKDKHKKVDDYPYGGGPGMVMTPQPIYDAYQSIEKVKENTPCIYLSPQGKKFDQKMAEELSNHSQVIFLCGHYEGVDQRVLDKIVTHEISLGDYVLTGGELPAMVIIDCLSRLLPGMLGNEHSAQEDSISSGLLEFPQYTRPYKFLDETVPEVLLSGNHEEIRKWRRRKSLLKTRDRRPDLFNKFPLSKEDDILLSKDDK